MWGYERTKEGYTIKHINGDNKYSGLTIQLPFKQKGDGWILYWNEKRVQQLITGLNDGSIPFDTDGVTFRMNTPPELTITSKEH
ncbi:MAG: hypothetical protein IJJ47_09330, partial [Methanosphaera sp.]|nr:hypothetical protein [Methanosphaera sp.]